MAGVMAAFAGPRGRAQEPGGARNDEGQEVRAVAEIVRRAGLKEPRTTRSTHFVAVGDAADGFLRVSLQDCEALLADYLDYYKGRGFAVDAPSRRLTVVAMADDRSFAAYVGRRELLRGPQRTAPDSYTAGLYQRDTNRLVVYDHRALGPQLSPRPEFDNIRVVAHEGTHMLTFNTGLLRRDGDLPVCVAEGLAMFSEVRKFTGRTPPGALNQMRLGDLTREQRRHTPWIPVAQLLGDDRDLRPGAGYRVLAYAESWLLVYYLMKDRARQDRFRSYLEALRPRNDPGSRLEDARQHLGDLGRLDQDVRAYANRLRTGR
jgi:hypothetical protein